LDRSFAVHDDAGSAPLRDETVAQSWSSAWGCIEAILSYGKRTRPLL